MESKIYKGKYKLKFNEGNHSYFVAKKQKNGDYGKWERKSSVTTYTNIKDKSRFLIPWAVKLASSYLLQVLEKGHRIDKYHIEEAKNKHTEVKESAATLGSRIHDWIEKYVKGEKPSMPTDDSVILGVNAFLDWVEEHKVKFVESETPIFSEKYDFTGTADAVARFGKKKGLYLIDYKTGNALYDSVMMQTAAYARAYEEMTGEKIIGRWAIRLEKRSEEEFKQDMEDKGKMNEEYHIFEAVYLDYEKDDMEIDFSGFLGAMELHKWGKDSWKRLKDYQDKQ